MGLTSDGEATETPLGLQLLGLADGGLGRKHNGVGDETVLVSLDLADHLGLILRSAVVVDNTQTSQQSHVDGHVVLGNGIHGGREKGGLEGETPGDLGI